jgi:glycosyltransferase involved in cell wall biosynthesis
VVAASRGIPVVLSFHDYYFACPTVHLVDHRLDYCGGLCSAGDGDCHAPFDRPEGSLPSLKHRFVYQWRAEVQQALAGVDAFVTTSPQAREVHLRALPSLARRQFAVIEHGRDFTSATTATTTSAAPEPGGLVRIAVPGNLDLHKGAELMRAILAHDLSGRISFELLGDIPEQYADLGRVHGPYQRQELAARLTRIAPAFVGIFSIWAETYSHILSEAWAAGVPVIATNLGALRERVQRHGGGWLVDPDDPRGAVETILSIADDPDAYEHGRAGATVVNVRSVAEMSADYIALYRQVSDRRRVFVPRRAGAGMRHLSHGILRAAVIVPGAAGNFPGSTHVRLLRRLRHPSLQRKVQATIHHGSELSELPPDRHLVIVQRTAVAPERVDWFIDAIAARELPLVLDLDDDLFALGERDEEYGDQLASLERLLAAASLVTVSTPTLERVIARRGAPTLLIENMIDERLFFAGKGGPARRSRAANAPAQILYMGSPTHQRDLALLAPVLDRLRQDRVPMVLNVAGRFALGDQTDWYRSLPVPPGRGGYPQFIGWLRAQRQEWDFAVAPLVDTDFNRSKSDLKFLEYAALGLPGAFSQLTAYASVEHGVTGLLVENQADAWYEAIAQLADSPGLRDELAEHALEYVLSRRLLRHGADRLLSALFDLVAGSRDQAPRGL